MESISPERSKIATKALETTCATVSLKAPPVYSSILNQLHFVELVKWPDSAARIFSQKIFCIRIASIRLRIASIAPGALESGPITTDNYRAFCYLLNFSSDYLVTGECPHSPPDSAARNLFICVSGQFVCNYLNLISVA